MHTLTIDGVAIAVTDADREEAEALFNSDGFQEDLKALTADGKPLWDGRAPLAVREASEDEAAMFGEIDFDDDEFDDEDEGEAIDGESLGDEEDEDDEDADAFDVMFLVPLDQFPDEA